MTEYEKLLDNAEKENIIVFDKYDLSNTRLKGLYCDGVIALNKSISSEKERICILAEELGHYYTSSGDILNQKDVLNRQQERRARAYAHDMMIGLSGIIAAFEYGCQNRYEAAEYLNVTERFLEEAINQYRSRYGMSVCYQDYLIYFEPALGVMKML